jgi:hypothetical protein
MDMEAPKIKAFLSYLTNERQVGVATHKQALCSLLFLYKQVAEVPLNSRLGNRVAKEEALVLFGTAVFAMWNIGIAFVFGILVYQLLKRAMLEL